MGWWHGDHMAGMWVLWTLAIVLIVLVSWFLARGWDEAMNTADSSEEEFPSGEIDHAEYNRSLEDLRR